MLAGNVSLGPSARRKRPVISCRECHRRKQKCDRRQPCSQCIRRGKKDACLYELDDVRSAAFPSVELEEQSTNGATQNPADTTSAASKTVEDDFRLLGYANNTKGTLGIIDGLGESPTLSQNCRSHNDSALHQYTSIIRELPPRRHMEILVQAFFKNVAWHYDIVDEVTFTNQLCQWSHLTHNQLKQAPDSLPSNLRSFPALLFQVLAQSLLFQPIQHDESLDDLKYAADMDLCDRAAEYSDAGHRLALLFKKSELTIATVQAELMRACFEKTTGAVREAWHTLGGAIRDGQELGLHLLGREPTQYMRTERPSNRDLGRKVWLILHLWDAHMATVLGRPMSTRMSPNDVPLPMSSSCDSGSPRLPQPRDVILCGYHTAYRFLQDIQDLEKIEDCRFLVENIHETLSTNIANLPAWATPLRSRQDEPPWLSAALEEMFTNIYFVLFALHRPFIFAEPSSRGRAFHSAVQILESQARLFDQMEPLQYKAFSLVYATFDSLVLIAAVHIRFPDEFIEYFPATKRNLEWGLDRLSLLQARNDLARSAFNVVQRLYRRMLAVVSPMLSSHPLYVSSETGNFAGMEAEMLAQVDWDGILNTDLGNMIPPQPLNELLSITSLGICTVDSMNSFNEL